MSNKVWIIIFSAVCAVMAAVWILHSSLSTKGAVAKISQDGKIIKTISLENVNEPYEFVVSSEYGNNTVRVENGKIAVIDADCPDKLCVKKGFASGTADMIVCLPHRLSITISGGGGDFDATAGGG